MKSTRAPYGFKLTFPSTPFTLRDLRNQKKRSVSYIAVYKRIEKALEEGVIAAVGEKPAKRGSRGRPQIVYTRADAKQVVISATKIPTLVSVTL
jgi:hypothetical protein